MGVGGRKLVLAKREWSLRSLSKVRYRSKWQVFFAESLGYSRSGPGQKLTVPPTEACVRPTSLRASWPHFKALDVSESLLFYLTKHPCKFQLGLMNLINVFKPCPHLFFQSPGPYSNSSPDSLSSVRPAGRSETPTLSELRRNEVHMV